MIAQGEQQCRVMSKVWFKELKTLTLPVPEASARGVFFSSSLAPSMLTKFRACVSSFTCAASPARTIRDLRDRLEAGVLSLPGSGRKQLTTALLRRASPVLVRL